MSGPENTFISSVHRHLPPVNELYRMKNHNVYNSGIADVWYSGTKRDLWIEYKFITIPKKNGAIIDLIGGKEPIISHLQQEWLRERHNEGRNVGVIVGSKNGGVWLHGTAWTEPLTAQQFGSLVHSRADLAAGIFEMVA